MNQELKPCPCCGGESQAIFESYDKLYQVRCLKCRLISQQYRLEESAIEAWNQRHDPTTDKLVEALWAALPYLTHIARGNHGEDRYSCNPKTCPECLVRVALAQVEKERGDK